MESDRDEGWAIPRLQGTHARISDIVREVCRAFAVRQKEILMHGRNNRHVVLARSIAMFLARDLTGMSFPVLGRHFDRNHSTIILNMQRMQKRIAADPKLAEIVAELKRRLT